MENGSNATEDLVWFLFILVVLFMVWFATGGPEHDAATGGVFLRPLAPIDTGETYGSISLFGQQAGEGGAVPEGAAGAPAERESLLIAGIHGVKGSTAEKEYIFLRANAKNSAPLLATGLRLQNKAGFAVTLPEAVSVPRFGQVNEKAPVFLAPGEQVYVTTGNSPVGMSFRVNRCSGYLEQFRDFSPALPQSCPSPLEGVDKATEGISDECARFINRIPRCTVVIEPLPDELPQSCRDFILKKIGHNSCVAAHQNDSNFSTGEWRLFLGLDRDLWNNEHDIIRLTDQYGNYFDSVSY